MSLFSPDYDIIVAGGGLAGMIVASSADSLFEAITSNPNHR